MMFVMRQVLWGGAAMLLMRALVRHRKRREDRKHAETQLDESLEETFPASDPPATQDYDIPVNRR